MQNCNTQKQYSSQPYLHPIRLSLLMLKVGAKLVSCWKEGTEIYRNPVSKFFYCKIWVRGGPRGGGKWSPSLNGLENFSRFFKGQDEVACPGSRSKGAWADLLLEVVDRQCVRCSIKKLYGVKLGKNGPKTYSGPFLRVQQLSQLAQQTPTCLNNKMRLEKVIQKMF